MEQETMAVRNYRCPFCLSTQTYVRLKSKARVCRGCGRSWSMDSEEDFLKSFNPLDLLQKKP